MVGGYKGERVPGREGTKVPGVQAVHRRIRIPTNFGIYTSGIQGM